MFSNRTLHSILAVLSLGGALLAQTPAVPPADAAAVNPPAEAKPDLATLQAAARDAEAKLPSPEVKPQSYFDLSPLQRDRWQTYLPQTLLKLTRREPLQIVVLGDAILGSADAGAATDPLLTSFVGVFAKSLATQFYYTGGVRVLRPGMRPRSKEAMVMGPEILIQPVRTSSIVSAASALATVGFQGRPDVVLVAHGLEDGLAGTSAADIAAALRSLRDTVRGHRLEMIVAGPVAPATEPAEESLASTRTASSVMRDFCEAEKVLFSDLGDLSRLVIPPAGTQAAHLLFPALVLQYQSRFKMAPGGTTAMPSEEMHDAMGRILYQDVMQGSPELAWAISDARVEFEGQGRLKLSFQVANRTNDVLALTVLPLVPAGLKLKDARPDIKLAAGAKEAVTVSYSITDTRFLPLSDGKARLPVLVIAGRESRIHDLTATLRPFSAAWNVRTAFNQDKDFLPDLEIENTAGQSLAATWELNWAGQKQTGKAALDANGAETLTAKLALPAEGTATFRQRLPLQMSLEANGVKQIFDRYVELTRNFGLKETVRLTTTDDKASTVTLRADADSMKLFLTLELTGVDLVDDASGQAYELLLNLDARSYGKRLTPGATAAIRITGKAGDGAAKVDDIAPWAFGSGYAAVFDPAEIGAALSSSAAGVRRLTITLPRSYLYMHEWALGNGNSELGINLRFNGGGGEHFLTRSTRRGDDAEGLSVLELTDKPTGRWTVRVE
ncbi:MAG: hypothetical protein IAE77_20210 [Prosthecobacter sp.]|jgi:hypothetical protein|uniref:hypothetical protein n=1 Tax=Prosthecobacter sp. TaxID=1965333 RepID=UPI0019DAA759|nr:hypothetical protein [Prosthecobacter sp.]MBE2285796.1 hypothetical protein [Prosthecobacter sp.]